MIFYSLDQFKISTYRYPKKEPSRNFNLSNLQIERRITSNFRAQEWLNEAKMQNVFRKINGCMLENKPLELTTIGINNTPYRKLITEETIIQNKKSCN